MVVRCVVGRGCVFLVYCSCVGFFFHVVLAIWYRTRAVVFCMFVSFLVFPSECCLLLSVFCVFLVFLVAIDALRGILCFCPAAVVLIVRVSVAACCVAHCFLFYLRNSVSDEMLLLLFCFVV